MPAWNWVASWPRWGAATSRRARRAASAVVEQLGATREREQAALLLRQLPSAGVLQEPTESANALTGRQVEILRLVARGQSDKEVAVALAISEHTVHRHIANILQTLDVPSRAAAVA